MNFTAIDFETATGYRNSACAVGIVSVKNGKIVDKYYTLIQPPENYYWYKFIEIHGITPEATASAPFFPGVFKEIEKRIKGKTIVAHNECFDRSVLKGTMDHYKLDYNKLRLSERWDCTLQIYRSKGFDSVSLDACCEQMGIELDHHHALSDALACARLYLLQ